MRFRKLSVILIALLFIAGGLCFSNVAITSAEEQDKTFDILQVLDINSGKATLPKVENEDFAKINFAASQYINFKNKLAFLDFSASIAVQKAEFEELSFNFNSNAPENSSDSTVTNSLKFSSDGEKITVKLNDGETFAEITGFDGEYSAFINITSVKGSFKINETEIGTIKDIEKYAADLTIKNTGTNNTSIILKSINKQELKINSNNEIVSEDKAPIIIINDDLDAPEGFFIPLGLIYTIDFDAYDVLSQTITTVLKYNKVDDEKIRESKDKTFIVIKLENKTEGDKYELTIEAKDENKKIGTTDKVVGEETIKYKVTVKTDNKAPILSDTFDNVSYQDRVEKAAYSDYDDKKFVNLGSGEYYYIPNFKGMFEDQSSYKNMRFDMEYDTPSTSGRKSTKLSASSLKIELTEVGTYSFKLKAIDQLGNTCEQYSKKFYFYVGNTSGPRITAPASNDNGYLGSSYTSNAFTVKGVDTVSEYKLEYRATPNDEFVLAEEELSGMTFMPKSLGEYKITLSVHDINGMAAESSTIISIADKVKVIRGEVNWAKDNILSIVFLCTGSLSLIGIIVLLLVKPTETTVATVDKKTLKKD